MRLADLKLNPDNPRNISEEKLDKLAESIKSFPKMMVKRPIVYDENKVIIGGNMRYRAIQKLGMSEIPDEWTSDASDFTPEERHRFIMQDNAEMGVTDWDMVANQYELEDLDAWGIEVPYADTNEEVEEDEAPEISSEPPISKLGEIYQLGRHRVMCGDSTDYGQISDLLDGQKMDMVYTDPPYGMFLDTAMSARQTKKDNWVSTPKKYDKVIGDNDDFKPELITVIFDMFDHCKEIFIFGADYFAELIPNRNAGSWIVWDKRAGVESMKWSTSEFELCWSKQRHQRKTARVTWSGILGTEQEFDHSDGRSHPTQKPTKLANWFFTNWAKDIVNVVDLYLGSGSTLIACEQTDRTCYGMELDPKYVDVIRKRYAKFTSPDDTLPDNWEELTPAIKGE